MQVSRTQHAWTTSDGETFSYSHWEALKDKPRAVIVAIHGLSGAAQDFEPLGQRLAPLGFATFAPELRGQGNDPVTSRRGDLASIDEWFRDLTTFLALVRARHPGLPIHYYGESMGAALLTRYTAQAASKDLPAGLILASPVVTLEKSPPAWQELVFRFFLFLRPTQRVNIRRMAKPKKGEAPKWVTRDEAHRAWFETAQHKLDAFSFRFFKCLLDLIGGCYAAAPQIKVPVLVIYAANDVFITTEKVEEFFQLLGSDKKELQLFPESYHLLLHDHDKEEVLNRVQAWLVSDLAGCTTNAKTLG